MRLMPDKDAFLVKRMEIYNEYELISHSKLADCTMFIVDMVYRPMHLHKELELCVVLSGGDAADLRIKAGAEAVGDLQRQKSCGRAGGAER